MHARRAVPWSQNPETKNSVAARKAQQQLKPAPVLKAGHIDTGHKEEQIIIKRSTILPRHPKSAQRSFTTRPVLFYLTCFYARPEHLRVLMREVRRGAPLPTPVLLCSACFFVFFFARDQTGSPLTTTLRFILFGAFLRETRGGTSVRVVRDLRPDGAPFHD